MMTKPKVPTIKGVLRSVKKQVKGVAHKIERTGQLIIHGKNGYSENAKRVLNAVGDDIVNSCILARGPIQKPVNQFIDLVGGKYPYDKLFHLQLRCHLSSGKQIVIEKNEVITLTIGPGESKKDADYMEIDQFRPNITVNSLLENAKVHMGGNYFPYSAHKNNCQNYILGILHGNNFNQPHVNEWVKQDTDSIFKKRPWLSKIADTATSAAGNFSAVSGQGIGDNNFKVISVKKMRLMISAFNKKQHVITKHSKLNAAGLRAMLSTHFDIMNNELIRKSDVVTTQQKVKKRIQPTLISEDTGNAPAFQNTSGLTKGQQRYQDKIEEIEMKAKRRELRAHERMRERERMSNPE